MSEEMREELALSRDEVLRRLRKCGTAREAVAVAKLAVKKPRAIASKKPVHYDTSRSLMERMAEAPPGAKEIGRLTLRIQMKEHNGK